MDIKAAADKALAAVVKFKAEHGRAFAVIVALLAGFILGRII